MAALPWITSVLKATSSPCALHNRRPFRWRQRSRDISAARFEAATFAFFRNPLRIVGASLLTFLFTIGAAPAAQTITCSGDVGIPFVESMAVLAVGFPDIVTDKAEAAAQVLPVGDGFQVFGIHTGRGAAEMVKVKTTGNGTDKPFVNDAVGQTVFVMPNAYVPIAMTILGPRPEPTGIRIASLLLRQPIGERDLNVTHINKLAYSSVDGNDG